MLGFCAIGMHVYHVQTFKINHKKLLLLNNLPLYDEMSQYHSASAMNSVIFNFLMCVTTAAWIRLFSHGSS